MRNWHGVTAALCVVLLADCGASNAPGGNGASAGLGGAAGSAGVAGSAAGGGAQSGGAGSAPLGNGGSAASAGSSVFTNGGSSGVAGAIAGGAGGALAGSSGMAGGVAGSGAGGAGTAGTNSVAPNVQGTPECDAFCTKLAKCPGAMCDTFDCRILPGSCAAETRALLTCTTNTGKFLCEGNGLYEVTDECPRMPDLCK